MPVARKHMLGAGKTRRRRRCAICGELGDYLPHGDPLECERWMQEHEGRGCAAPSEHHLFLPLVPLHRQPEDSEPGRRETLHRQVSAVLDSLDKQERRILSARFGLADGRTLSLAEIGAEMGLSAAAVRQIETRALRKLRRPQV